jgi:glycosyltransferase involved in cell wall biosynthesis
MPVDRNKLVSICIPTFNDSSVVADALNSALQQTYAPFEILVLDNHSSDDTWSVVTSIAAGDRRVRCIRNPENLGMAANFSACIAQARGEHVLILCSDDVLEPECIARLASALDQHPNAVLAACARIWADPSLRPQRILRARREPEEIDASILLTECFSRGNRIGEPSAVLFRRIAASRGFDPDYSQALDLEMWFYLLQQGSAVLLPQPLCRIRQHEDQTTKANIASGRIIEDKRRLFRQYADKVHSSLGFFGKMFWDLRMASSAARFKASGGGADAADISEVFFRATFRYVLCPLLSIAWRIGRARPYRWARG